MVKSDYKSSLGGCGEWIAPPPSKGTLSLFTPLDHHYKPYKGTRPVTLRNANGAPTAATSYGNALITPFDPAPHGFIPPFFAQERRPTEHRPQPSRRRNRLPDARSTIGGPQPRRARNPRAAPPRFRETRIRTSDGVYAYGNTSPVFGVRAQAGSESVGPSAARERVRLASKSARCLSATRAFLCG